MATKIWRGDAAPTRQVTWLTPGETAVAVGDRWSLTINRKTISVTAGAATVANLISAMVTAIGDTSIPEFQEVTATTGVDQFGNPTHLILTGPTDGKPFTVSSSASAAQPLGVSITEIQKGSAARNEIQVVTLPDSTSGGTFTLQFEDETTANIAYNASAATVSGALELLTNIGPVGVTVSGDAGGPWTIEFDVSYPATNVPLLYGNGANLTGACTVRVTTLREGAYPYRAWEWALVATENSPGYYRLSVQYGEAYGTGGSAVPETPTYTTATISPFATAAQVEAALEALPNVGAGNISVTSDPNDLTGFSKIIRPKGQFFFSTVVGSDDPAIAVDNDDWTITQSETSASTATTELQLIEILGVPTGGTFTLTFEGQTTSAITYTPSTDHSALIDAALEALSNIGAGEVSVAMWQPDGSSTTSLAYVVTFTNTTRKDVGQMTGSGASLTGGAIGVNTIQTHAAAVNEVIDVTLTGSPTGGTFTLTYSGQTTGTIAYNASAATVTSALEALSNIGVGDVSVTASGTLASGYGWRIEFTALLAGADQVLTASGASLTGAGADTFTVSTATTPTGPHHWDNANNWDTGAVPVNSDDIVFENNDVDCLYGLDASAVTLTSLTIKQSYSGKIGLAVKTDTEYYEYRETYLKVGATTLTIGIGEGEGSQRIKINNGTIQTTVIVVDSGQSADALPAIQWKGTHASNVVRVSKGSFGAAVLAGETAAIATLAVGYREDQDADAQVVCGPGVTLTNVDVSGGAVELASATTTIDQTAGLLTITAAAHASIDIDGGQMVYKGTGTITTLSVSGDGQADFSQDMRGKTITNAVQLYRGATFNDPYGIVTLSAGYKTNRCTLAEVTVDVGPDRTYAVS